MFLGVERNRAVPAGKLDWSQIMKGLKCEAKLFGFLFGRQGAKGGLICVWLCFG